MEPRKTEQQIKAKINDDEDYTENFAHGWYWTQSG